MKTPLPRLTPGQQLLQTVSAPQHLPDLPPEQQDLTLRLARKSGLLAHLAIQLHNTPALARLTPRVQDNLEGARLVAEEQERMLHWEVNRIRRALSGTGIAIILLKGAAYALAGLPMARGRLVGDVDILAPKPDLPLIEERLTAHGWSQVKLNPYDQRYYREWMHELPPMRHWERLTEVDIHHTILPVSGRLCPDPALLLDDAIPVSGNKGVWILSPVDMVLHAVVHLFYDSDFGRGLRDLVDLDALFRHFGAQPGFWQQLIPRARRLDLARPLYYALHHLTTLLQTPVPDAVLSEIRAQAPSPPVRMLMNHLIPHALLPGHPERPEFPTLVAWWLLYLRSHWLRMPPGLLLAHLTRKLSRRWNPDVRNRRTL